MGKRTRDKPDFAEGAQEGLDEGPGGRDENLESVEGGPADEPARRSRKTTDDTDVSWGPGKNFSGWAMTLVVLGLLAGVVLAGFKLFGETVANPVPSASGEGRRELERQAATLGADLCAAATGAGGAPDASVQIFEQKVHGPLHAVADALAEEDRPAAGTLLRRKFNLEQDIRRKAPPPELTVTFAALNETTMDALRILSLPSPACPPPAAPPPAPPPPAP